MSHARVDLNVFLWAMGVYPRMLSEGVVRQTCVVGTGAAPSKVEVDHLNAKRRQTKEASYQKKPPVLLLDYVSLG